MRVLVIGGTRFIGPAVVGNLVRLGHAVTVFHRGNHRENIPAGVGQILARHDAGKAGDKYNLRASADAFRRLRPDVVVHMRLFTRQDAETFLDVFHGAAGRVVAPGSMEFIWHSVAFGAPSRDRRSPRRCGRIPSCGTLRRSMAAAPRKWMSSA